MEFLKQHHAELADLLQQLKTSNLRQYEKAMRELHRAKERLEVCRKRDPQRHALELHAWKLQSRAQLLAARLTMSDSSEKREELRKTLADHLAAQRELLERDRERLLERLQRIDGQLEKLRSDEPQIVDRHMKQLTGQAAKNRSSGKQKAPAAARGDAEPSDK